VCSSDLEVFYELVGYCLWKDYQIEKAVMMVGGGRNGKGKTIEMIKSKYELTAEIEAQYNNYGTEK
jgi:phage/plasmid-associated DNA primase